MGRRREKEWRIGGYGDGREMEGKYGLGREGIGGVGKGKLLLQLQLVADTVSCNLLQLVQLQSQSHLKLQFFIAVMVSCLP